ncbi:DUF2933 domain-containing protein [Methylobacterium nonmethylotrophicum]|uniref:DUF2933 domain-containing protein n=1 Tax=Methylobacterium nonmethylotrophicum TaxID=1141884 RepID=A0A4Z0NMS8_9HYPH|nr:DUF2933 domain-containing protein [Methylobacterium nonmethylotrophicum]TGD97707.1 DUF2933 domain-containing protein [Methylobacterium nonmethylotrophicum]
MDQPSQPQHPYGKVTAWAASSWGLLLTLVLAALGIYLLMSHTGHMLSALPYLLLIACPLIHVFMHHGHRHDERHDI